MKNRTANIIFVVAVVQFHLFGIMATLNLTEVADIPWLLVTLPLWLPIVSLGYVGVIGALGYALSTGVADGLRRANKNKRGSVHPPKQHRSSNR